MNSGRSAIRILTLVGTLMCVAGCDNESEFSAKKNLRSPAFVKDKGSDQIGGDSTNPHASYVYEPVVVPSESPSTSPEVSPSETPLPTILASLDPTSPPTPTPTSTPIPTPTPNPFANFEPVFAVRQPSCISCHAKVKGDLITDFMYGTNYFFGSPSFPFDNIHRYWGQAGMRPDTFGNLNLRGSFVIPQATIQEPSVVSRFDHNPAGGLSLYEALTSPSYMAPDPSGSAPDAERKLISVIGPTRDQNLPGVDKLETVSAITIDPPKAADLEQVFADSAKVTVASSGSVVLAKAEAAMSLSGMVIANGVSGPFVRNSGTVVCRGDIFIRGTLVLNNLRVTSDIEGCRLYVIGAVFIEGSISHSGAQADLQNLQIVASHPIFMGIETIEGRLGNMYNHSAYYSYNAVIAERDNVASSIADDAGAFFIMWDINISSPIAITYAHTITKNPPAGPGQAESVPVQPAQWQPIGSVNLAGKVCSYNWAATPGNVDQPLDGRSCAVAQNVIYQRKAATFKQVLFVAPAVHSRYDGSFKGSIVAGIVMFSLSSLNYEYEPILRDAMIFPKLTKPFLTIIK